ncbi:hypothetical protein Tco_0057728 [Tanacetum coccineum]
MHSIVFFSSGSGLTADSSVLTLTLTFLDFGLDFAQSFPFHAQFCHFGSVFSSVRRDLQLEDADGVDCLPDAIIFKQLTLMGMVKNLDTAVKFLMYPRFVQVFLNNQLEGMATHNRIYIAPSHTKKLFANMRRQGTNFSGRVTPLFPTMVVQAQEEMGEGSSMPTDPHHTPIITQPSSSQPQRKQKLRRPKEKDTEIPQSSVPSDPTNVADEVVIEEPSMQLKELMDFCTKLQQRVLDLENTKTTQANEITKESLGDQKDASKQERIDDIDADKDIYLVNVQKDEDIFGVNDLEGDEIVVESEFADKDPSVPVSAASKKVSIVIPTTAATTITAVSSRPRAKRIVFHEQEQAPTLIVSSQQPTQVKDKGKGKIVKEEPMKKMSKKELLKLDEELAFKLQAKKDEEERLARETKSFKKNEKFSSTLFIQLLEKRRKHFAAKRAEEKRNTPPTKAQQRSFMYTYLKNMEGWKPKDLKNKSFANIQDLFDKAMKRVNTFVDMDTELVKESSKKAEVETAQESSSKRAGKALEQESSKKQKVDDDKETEELKKCMEIISDDGDDVIIEATPLSTKSLTVVDYKIYKKGKKSYF